MFGIRDMQLHAHLLKPSRVFAACVPIKCVIAISIILLLCLVVEHIVGMHSMNQCAAACALTKGTEDICRVHLIKCVIARYIIFLYGGMQAHDI